VQTQLDSKIGSASAINPTIVDAKGDIIAATAADTVARLAVGTNGQVLTAASGQATGLQWTTISAIPANDTATVATSQTTTSTSYTDLATAGPAVTVTTGTKALVIVSAFMQSPSSAFAYTSFAVSGATTIAASDNYAFRGRVDGDNNQGIRINASRATVVTLTAGSNTFTAKYKVDSGTGTFANRDIFVINLA
jgi:hypothetical protein